MATRVAINGFGRTGRCTFRATHERDADLEIVAVNDLADARTLAHLLQARLGVRPLPRRRRDRGRSAGGGRPGDPRPCGARAAASCPGASSGVDVVIESSGRFRTREAAGAHLSAGARKVIISAPAKDPDVTVALGVNFDHVYDLERHHIISNASCTTNCLAPVAKILHEDFGIRHGLMATVHAYTADQMLQDGPHKDLRRARAAAVNMIPTSTGAAKALGLVVPELEGRLHGYALRVPIPTGSVVDLTVEVNGPTTVEAVNYAFARRADSGPLEGILAYSDEPLVSSDIVGSPYSAVFDSGFTSVDRRDLRQGAGLVRQRVGLRQPARRSSPSGCSRRCSAHPARSRSKRSTYWRRWRGPRNRSRTASRALSPMARARSAPRADSAPRRRTPPDRRASTRTPVSPSTICSRMPPTRLATTGRAFHIASATVRPNPSARLFCTTMSARRCRAFTIAAFSWRSSIGSERMWIRSRISVCSRRAARATSNSTVGPLGVVRHGGGGGADEHEVGVGAEGRSSAERLEHAGRILEPVPARDLA